LLWRLVATGDEEEKGEQTRVPACPNHGG